MRLTGPAKTHNRHKVGFSEQVKEVIRISDIVLETVDARFIQESRIPELEELIKAQGKMLVHVVTKVDLVGVEKLKGNLLINSLSYPVLVSTTKRTGLGNLRERIHILAKKFAKERKNIHVGVIGYPNTGKSSVISLLARRAAAPVSSHSGFTKHVRKVRFAKGIQLLDAPGVVQIGENIFSNKDIKKHALLGVHVPETVRNADMVVDSLMKSDYKKFDKFYGIETNGDTEVLLDILGKRWNFIKKKGMIDIDRAARKVLRDWHQGSIK